MNILMMLIPSKPTIQKCERALPKWDVNYYITLRESEVLRSTSWTEAASWKFNPKPSNQTGTKAKQASNQNARNKKQINQI